MKRYHQLLFLTPTCCMPRERLATAARDALVRHGYAMHSLDCSKNTITVKIQDADLEQCANASRTIAAAIDPILEDPYTLEVSSPGVADVLTSEQDFEAFQGFPVVLELNEGKNKIGSLKQVLEKTVQIAVKGRIVSVEREKVIQIRHCKPHEIV